MERERFDGVDIAHILLCWVAQIGLANFLNTYLQ